MKKRFDCVAMKNAIQRQLIEEERPLSFVERKRRSRDRVAADPILGPWVKRQQEKRRDRQE